MPLKVTVAGYFPPNYYAARAWFREAVDWLGWQTEAHPIDAAGPDGKELTIDVAVSPTLNSDRTVVVSSGLHGVEGFFGSAVQAAWLDRQKPGPLPARLVFLHALNPYGFAHVRRYDETNADPNRNFLLPGEAYVGAPPGYAELDPVLNPRSPPRRIDLFPLRGRWEVLTRGLPAMKRIIMTGQYEYPRGVFFGGAGPSRSNRVLAANLGRWVAGSREVVHLDLHCGLGPWATYKLLIDYPLTHPHRSRLEQLFGPSVIEACDVEGTGTAYYSRGDFGRWCVAQGLAKDYLFACAEFGTYGPVTMLAGIRAENRAFHWADPGSAATRRSKRRLMDLFCPADAGWRETVVDTGTTLIDRAVAGGQSGA
jgi:hypothetical protein